MPRAVPGITLGHEMVGVVEAVGTAVTQVKPGTRVAVNVETFCGECFFCRRGWVNNCTHPSGGWALGCRIDGGQAPYVRVPLADQGLTPIPDGVSDRQALFVGDILATGYWAADITPVEAGDTVLLIGAGPTGGRPLPPHHRRVRLYRTYPHVPPGGLPQCGGGQHRGLLGAASPVSRWGKPGLFSPAMGEEV